MLMPKKNLVAIYEHLFTEGVIVAMKDTHAPKHPGNIFCKLNGIDKSRGVSPHFGLIYQIFVT
jgi:hypothetical protein